MLQFAWGTDFLMGCFKAKWEVFLVEERKKHKRSCVLQDAGDGLFNSALAPFSSHVVACSFLQRHWSFKVQ
jgi:hypothetical protein